MIAIINYGSGNIRAIANIYDRQRIPYTIVNEPEDLLAADKIILPGVGAFDETMGMLNKSGFKELLTHAVIEKKMPVLGICVGMQILSEGSEEGNLPGLGWISGFVKKFDKSLLKHKPKIPHLGWNSVEINKQSTILDGIDVEQGFYFIHSYYFQCNRKEDILTTSTYGINFSSAVNLENIFGVQFHPEKSHHNGMNLLKNFSLL